jgi:hypothetical protein
VPTGLLEAALECLLDAAAPLPGWAELWAAHDTEVSTAQLVNVMPSARGPADGCSMLEALDPLVDHIVDLALVEVVAQRLAGELCTSLSVGEQL